MPVSSTIGGENDFTFSKKATSANTKSSYRLVGKFTSIHHRNGPLLVPVPDVSTAAYITTLEKKNV